MNAGRALDALVAEKVMGKENRPMIDPFVICSVAEQAIYRAYDDRYAWQIKCLVLGATAAMLDTYNQDAIRYASTTVYANSDVVAYCRKLATEALLRGEPMPTNAEQAVEQENARRLKEAWGKP